MKILIIQLRQLGDVLLSTPIAENIKFFYPHSEVHFLTSEAAKDIVTENPFIDKVIILKNGILNEIKIELKIRKTGYHAILDIQRTGRSKRITLFSKAKIRAAFDDLKDNLYYNVLIKQTTEGYTAFERLDILKAIGIQTPTKTMPKLFFSKAVEQKIKDYLKRKKISKYFIVAPTARKTTKMWDPEEFGKLSQIISETFNIKAIIVYGSDREREIAEKCSKHISNSHIIDKPFSIKEFAALAKNAAFSLGNDSFPSHISVSQNIKTIVICGPTSGWFIQNKKTLLIYKGLKCQPCNNPEKCPFNLACYKELKHYEIVDKIMEFLNT